MKKGLKMSNKTKKALYGIHYGEMKIIEYNPDFKCLTCGLPIKNASENGTMICFYCSKGVNKDLSKWTRGERIHYTYRFLYNFLQYLVEEII